MKRFLAGLAIVVSMVAPGLAGATENFTPNLGVADEVGENCFDFADGSSGKRIQAVYVGDGNSSMSAAEQFEIEQAIFKASLIISDNADGSDVRRLRYVHPQGDCAPTIITKNLSGYNFYNESDPGAIVLNEMGNWGYTAANYPDTKFAYFIEVPQGGASYTPCAATDHGYGWGWVLLPSWSNMYSKSCWHADSFLHELSHDQGAVASGAPGESSINPNHSDQNFDIIYDGSSSPTPCPVPTPIPDYFGTYDCQNDTYFDTQPEANEWLDQNPSENLAFSPFYADTDLDGCRVWEEPDMIRGSGSVGFTVSIICEDDTTVYAYFQQRTPGQSNWQIVKGITSSFTASADVAYLLAATANNCQTPNNDREFRAVFMGPTREYYGRVESFRRNCI